MWDSAVGWKTIEKKKPYRTPIYAQEALFLSSVVIIFTGHMPVLLTEARDALQNSASWSEIWQMTIFFLSTKEYCLFIYEPYLSYYQDLFSYHVTAW